MNFPPAFCHSSVLRPMQRLVSFTPLHIRGDTALVIHAECKSSADFPSTSLLTTV
jgi:hypothetical protein